MEEVVKGKKGEGVKIMVRGKGDWCVKVKTEEVGYWTL